MGQEVAARGAIARAEPQRVSLRLRSAAGSPGEQLQPPARFLSRPYERGCGACRALPPSSARGAAQLRLRSSRRSSSFRSSYGTLG
mmetsp:Transcript_4174/g.10647  ORF Transcript_4174/g.10647 Transcript_4174/m.10647 type:complete len:86 (-) Transcript_4174:1966-2223(-)